MNKIFNESPLNARQSYETYKNCFNEATIPAGININPEVPNKSFTFGMTDIGYHFFVCGIDSGYHCTYGHVRAVVQVVKDPQHCDFHTLG